MTAEVERRLLTTLRRNVQRALREGRFADAQSALERLRQRAPLAVETRAMELEWLIADRRADEARALSVVLLEKHPDSAGVREQAGRIAYADRDYARALEHFTECERRHPSWRARRWMGKSLAQLGRLEEAEAVLAELYAERPDAVASDLAWVYERASRPERALAILDAYLERHAANEFVSTQRLRLRARLAPADDLVGEAESLLGLGETLPPEMFITYVERLLETGRGELARRRIVERAPELDDRAALSLGWICHRHRALDLALGLLLRGLPLRPEDYKLLNALEADARRCERIDELREALSALAPRHPRLYGRLKALG